MKYRNSLPRTRATAQGSQAQPRNHSEVQTDIPCIGLPTHSRVARAQLPRLKRQPPQLPSRMTRHCRDVPSTRSTLQQACGHPGRFGPHGPRLSEDCHFGPCIEQDQPPSPSDCSNRRDQAPPNGHFAGFRWPRRLIRARGSGSQRTSAPDRADARSPRVPAYRHRTQLCLTNLSSEGRNAQDTLLRHGHRPRVDALARECGTTLIRSGSRPCWHRSQDLPRPHQDLTEASAGQSRLHQANCMR